MTSKDYPKSLEHGSQNPLKMVPKSMKSQESVHQGQSDNNLDENPLLGNSQPIRQIHQIRRKRRQQLLRGPLLPRVEGPDDRSYTTNSFR